MSSLLEYSISVIILLMLGGFLSILDLTNTILSSCNSSVLFLWMVLLKCLINIIIWPKFTVFLYVKILKHYDFTLLFKKTSKATNSLCRRTTMTRGVTCCRSAGCRQRPWRWNTVSGRRVASPRRLTSGETRTRAYAQWLKLDFELLLV